MCIGVYLGLFSIAVGVSGIDYCSLTCQGEQHTMCRYPPEGGASCRGYRGGLARREKKLILLVHNRQRQRVARGHEATGPQPPAADMMELVWDDELAMIAQHWADQCDAQGHDKCRITSDGSQVGQNIATFAATAFTPNRTKVLIQLMKSWYGEVKSFSPSLIDVFHNVKNVNEIGHYTQVVWARTTTVGCGVVDTSDKQGFYKFKLVCNYKPGGNVIGTSMYKRGKACSACPGGTKCSSKYRGLCVS